MDEETSEDRAREDVILKLARDRHLAHRVLFGHRHSNRTPLFHDQIIDAWHGPDERFLIMAFRGAAKSTLSEEGIIIEACLQTFNNAIILGASYERAVERLRSIKHEFETNPYIEELFGNLVGPTWAEGKIVLANGRIIQAYGRGQSLRGAKHLDKRPDRAFGDDIEDDESVATPEARDKTAAWLFSTVLPSLDPISKVRLAATPLDPDAVTMRLIKQDNPWPHIAVPIEHADEHTGDMTPSWPDRFGREWIDKEKKAFYSMGLAHKWMQEFMCQAEDPAAKTFTSDMFRLEPAVRTWQAVYAMLDPARSTNKKSASTGVAIWSWENNRLVIWDSYAKMWKPDEIVADVFRITEMYTPVVVGVEEDGLNEFLLQPLRQEQVKRGSTVPLRALKAPKGKMDFIKGLQPFFKAREVIFAKAVPELQAQLLSFPTGLIDAPNALAYALKLRPGMPVYDDFRQEHIAGALAAHRPTPCWLAVNAGMHCVTGVLAQYVNGALHILGDWVCEGDAGLNLGEIVRSATVLAGRTVRIVAGPQHFSVNDTKGLRAAARAIPLTMHNGGQEARGREEIRRMLASHTRGLPRVKVSIDAHWTLNGFAGGYARAMTKAGVLSDYADDGAYKVLMEGLEAFGALLSTGTADDSDNNVKYAYTGDGRRYVSALG